MGDFDFEEAEWKRKFEVFYLVGTIFVTIGIVRLFERIDFNEPILDLFLIGGGGFIFLIGTNKYFAKLFKRRR